MSVQGGIAGSSRQVLRVLVWNMSAISEPVFPSQPEVNQVHLTIFLPCAHHVVVWLSVSIQKSLIMHVLHPFNHLVTQHQARLHSEFTVALDKYILKRFAQ